jgi:hypothetical protein
MPGTVKARVGITIVALIMLASCSDDGPAMPTRTPLTVACAFSVCHVSEEPDIEVFEPRQINGTGEARRRPDGSSET